MGVIVCCFAFIPFLIYVLFIDKEADPKMKKVILDQISQLESIVKDISTRVNKDPNNISAAYAAFVNEELPDATTYQIEEEITDNFNKMVNKK